MSQFDRGLRRVTAMGLGALFVLLGAGPALAALVDDIYPGVKPSSPDHLVRQGNAILFSADDGVNGEELWKSDGTPSGTWMVKDIDPAANADSFPDHLLDVNGTVFFSSTSSVIWKGTTRAAFRLTFRVSSTA